MMKDGTLWVVLGELEDGVSITDLMADYGEEIVKVAMDFLKQLV